MKTDRYGGEAARLLVEYALLELGVDRVSASCDTRNVASERIMKRCGMRRVGQRPRRNRDGTRVFYAREREEGHP